MNHVNIGNVLKDIKQSLSVSKGQHHYIFVLGNQVSQVVLVFLRENNACRFVLFRANPTYPIREITFTPTHDKGICQSNFIPARNS